MAHMLKKYTSNRGSALFMVISTMTALFISCMAMYFSMVSARSSQFAVFNQVQAGQSAQSIVDIISVAINDPNNHAGAALRETMFELAVGESITTGANDFSSLDPSNALATKLDEAQLGAYAVTITRTPDEGGNKMFDIMVITSLDGNRKVVHYYIPLYESSEDDVLDADDGSGGDAELFSATGYLPNDAYIDGGYYLTDVFYDTQFTYMNAFNGGSRNRIGMSLSTGGDLMIGSNAFTVLQHHESDTISDAECGKIGPVTWAIRGNFYSGFGSDFDLRGGSDVLIGGDLSYTSNSNNFFTCYNGGYTGKAPIDDHISIYINGDLNYGGDMMKPNVWIFVNGNVTNISPNVASGVRVFVTGDTAAERAAKAGPLAQNHTIEEWPIDGPFDAGLNYTEAMAKLGQKTQTIAYYKWDLTKNTETATHVDIRLNSGNNEWKDDKGVTYEAGTTTYLLCYDENVSTAKYLKQKGGKDPGAIGNAFIIDSVWTRSGGDQNNPQNILIDTGDDPTNIMTIKLSDVTGNGEFSWFLERQENVISWYPYTVEYGDFYIPDGNNVINNNRRSVIIKGRGIVLIDVPKNVTYEDSGWQFTGHLGWWEMVAYKSNGIQIEEKNGHLTFGGANARSQYADFAGTFVHKTCEGLHAGEAGTGDGCIFTESESTAKCSECGGFQTQVTCSEHGDVNKYCPNCFSEKADRTNWCVNRVDRAAYDKFYKDNLSGLAKEFMTTKDNETIYPNTNFMLVSCEESADMRFTKLKNNKDVAASAFFGFIYAPYMTYLASGDTLIGGTIKLCGGMTVSDYDIKADYVFLGCYPDKMPNEIAGMMGGGSMAGGKLGGTTKSWKFEIGGYR